MLAGEAPGETAKSRVAGLRLSGRSAARAEDRVFTWINWRITKRVARAGARAARARLFHEPGRIRAGLRAGGRGAGDRGGSERGKYGERAAKRGAQRIDRSNGFEQDVFQFLRAAEKAEAEYDLIILDPPSFTKTKGGLRDALRGYRELHVRAFKLLSRMDCWRRSPARIT